METIAEMALEIAWKDAKAVYLSFDIDVIDAGFVPGTGEYPKLPLARIASRPPSAAILAP